MRKKEKTLQMGERLLESKFSSVLNKRRQIISPFLLKETRYTARYN